MAALSQPAHASSLAPHFMLLARYNVWATARLLAALQLLDDQAYRRPVGLFFGSIHGTLNHLLVGEVLAWQARFAGVPQTTFALNSEAETDRQRLSQRLLEGAAAWPALIEKWPAAVWEGDLKFQRLDGELCSLPFAGTLTHVFNHSTHHRGQITAALTAMGQPCPELDLVWMLRDEQLAMRDNSPPCQLSPT